MKGLSLLLLLDAACARHMTGARSEKVAETVMSSSCRLALSHGDTVYTEHRACVYNPERWSLG